MEPVRTGQMLRCGSCGVELQVVKNCESTCACSIICCGQPMTLEDKREEETIA